MRIPRYWTRATDTVEGPRRRRYRLESWGWSDRSVAEALQVARRRLSEVAARVASGDLSRKYPYGERPLREEIVRTLGGVGAADEAVVTRNRYGAQVLNTARVPFIDVDAPDPEPDWFRKLRALFGRRLPETPDAVLERIRAACRRHARHGFRIYRTRSGFRVIATDLLLDPTSESTRALLADFGSDPRFMQLCAVQQSFRARLTPKPWRCDCSMPPGQHPREDAPLRARFDAWLRGYETACERFATCRFLEQIGPERARDEARAILEEHDRVTKAQAQLPLA